LRLLALLLLIAGCANAPVFHEEDFARISVGMSGEEVRSVLGAPSQTEAFPRQGQVAWTYAFTDHWGYHAFASMIFDSDGRVVGKLFTRKEPEDG
jgi:outer membrane protein assembly factor BamE (lipoprotein component of BamABCDE complex)